jgi:hypothetical protein
MSAPLEPHGSGPESALALLNLAARVGHLVDPTVPASPAASLEFGEFSRVDWHQPGRQHARVGRVAVTRLTEVSDGIGGPVELFSGFDAVVLGLPPGQHVSLSWNGGLSLTVQVTAPAALKEAVAALVPGAQLRFTPC